MASWCAVQDEDTEDFEEGDDDSNTASRSVTRPRKARADSYVAWAIMHADAAPPKHIHAAPASLVPAHDYTHSSLGLLTKKFVALLNKVGMSNHQGILDLNQAAQGGCIRLSAESATCQSPHACMCMICHPQQS
jgi:hypothetical protein